MSLPKRKKRPANERRRTRPPASENKPSYPVEVSLAANVAELEARITKSNQQSRTYKLAADMFTAQKDALMKVVSELADAGEIDREAFDSIVQKELEDLGIVEVEIGAGEDDDEEDGE